MRLKKNFDFRMIFFAVYFLAFAVYLIIGLQPVQARDYDIIGELVIPRISLKSDVAQVKLETGKLDTPDTIVGSYSRNVNKTLLFGHSTTVFQDLVSVYYGDTIRYNDKTYVVDSIETVPKGEIVMSKLLEKEDVDTLVIMTCAGTLFGDGDATHRLLITASVQ